jgi:hypothetical protein
LKAGMGVPSGIMLEGVRAISENLVSGIIDMVSIANLLLLLRGICLY